MALDLKAIKEKGQYLEKVLNAHREKLQSLEKVDQIPADDAECKVILSVLAELRSSVAATQKLLQATRIGRIVNFLKDYPNAEVVQVSQHLVTQWRKKVATTSKAATTPTSTATTNITKKSDQIIKPSGKVKGKEKRDAKSDGVEWRATGNDMRDNSIRLIYDGLCLKSEEASDKILDLSKSIEAANLLLHESELSETYKSQMVSLFQRFRNPTDDYLRTSVLNGDITPEALVEMSPDDMKSEHQKSVEKTIMDDNLANAMVPQELQSVSSLITCWECHKQKVATRSMQTRSADEPMTISCACQNCGNRWKMN